MDDDGDFESIYYKEKIIQFVNKFLFLLVIVVSMMMTVSVFGQNATQVSLSLNKQSYVLGDTVIISGTITSPGASNNMILQVYGPDNILVQIGTVNISPDGKFITSVKAEGPSWSNDGYYTIKMIYASPPINTVATAQLNFKKILVTPNLVPSQSNPVEQNSNQTQDTYLEEQIQKRIAIANKLRDSINGNSSNYGNTPLWIKNDARDWHDGTTNNAQFSKGLQYLISTGIVKTDQNVYSANSFKYIPSWVKHIAGWWSEDLLSDNEYVKSIQYLLQNKIITFVN